METIQWGRELALALEARDRAQSRFEDSVGTSTEMGAYMRLRAATRRVAELDRAQRDPRPGAERETV
jgi:hypothetical protein